MIGHTWQNKQTLIITVQVHEYCSGLVFICGELTEEHDLRLVDELEGKGSILPTHRRFP